MAGKLITAAELIGFITALLMIVVATSLGISIGITIFVATLTGLSLWVAFRVYHEPFRSEPAVVWSILTSVCFVLALAITGFVIQSLELERDQGLLHPV